MLYCRAHKWYTQVHTPYDQQYRNSDHKKWHHSFYPVPQGEPDLQTEKSQSEHGGKGSKAKYHHEKHALSLS